MTEEKNGISRRGIVTGAASSIFEKLLPRSPKVGDVFFSDPDKLKKKFTENGKHNVWLNTAEVNFINIGVQHAKEDLPTQLKETEMGNILQAADIILLENSGDEGYFGLIYNQFKKNSGVDQNKIINFDKSNSGVSQSIGSVIDVYSFSELVTLPSSKDLKEMFIRFLKLLGISQYGVFFPIISDIALNSLAGNDLDANLTPFNPSHISDGRTVFMTLEYMKQRAANPNAKIVCITGQAHAQEINRYLNTKQGQLEFKKYIYNLFYGWLKIFDEKKWD